MQDDLTLRQIVDGISALVAVLTPDGAVEIVNRQVLDYFGKTLKEMREWSLTQTPFTRNRSPWRHCLVDAVNRERSALQHRAPANGARMGSTDGSMRKVSLCGMRTAASSVGSFSKPMSMSASAPRRRSRSAFEELAKSEAELRTIIDAIPQLIVSLRADGTFLSAFPSFPVAGTAGRRGRYTGTYVEFRADWRLTANYAIGLGAVHYAIGRAVRQAGGHDANYVGVELRYAW